MRSEGFWPGMLVTAGAGLNGRVGKEVIVGDFDSNDHNCHGGNIGYVDGMER